jgi:hypothetical protein
MIQQQIFFELLVPSDRPITEGIILLRKRIYVTEQLHIIIAQKLLQFLRKLLENRLRSDPGSGLFRDQLAVDRLDHTFW